MKKTNEIASSIMKEFLKKDWRSITFKNQTTGKKFEVYLERENTQQFLSFLDPRVEEDKIHEAS